MNAIDPTIPPAAGKGGRVGFTTTIPIEILYAAGRVPVDLNNLFIADPGREALLEDAKREGFSGNICGWIKGIYAAVRAAGIREVIAVVRGDCSNTQALMETFQFEGIETIPFAFPYDRDPEALAFEIDKLGRRYGASPEEVRAAKEKLDSIRALVHHVDELTWREGVVTGRENHLWQVQSSDMRGDPEVFRADLEAFLEEAKGREPVPQDVRIGLLGVPPIYDDLHEMIEAAGSKIVFNEVSRQFSMPFASDDLVEQYRRYTYPYDVFTRLADIETETRRRRIDGLIHYVQSFCFRQIEDLILRRSLDVPILTLEGDEPGSVDARSRVRIEAFLELLKGGRDAASSPEPGPS